MTKPLTREELARLRSWAICETHALAGSAMAERGFLVLRLLDMVEQQEEAVRDAERALDDIMAMATIESRDMARVAELALKRIRARGQR